MICKVCGSQIPDGSEECEFCGAKLNEVPDDATRVIASEEIINEIKNDPPAQPEEIFDENEKKRNEQMKKMMEDKQRQLSEIERRRNEKRARQKRNKIIVIALICALAVGAAGAGAYYVMQNVNSGKEIVVTPAPTQTVPALAAPTAPADTPVPSVTPAALAMSPAPNTSAASASAASENGQSWTAANRSTSSNSSSSSAGSTSSSTSGTASSSSGGSSSGGSSSGSASSGGSSSGGRSQSTSSSGLSRTAISSGIVTGGEVLRNTGTGRYLMTFVKDGVLYYANVSEGSTTEQIKNKTFTINADPTNESYNGNTVYEISSMTGYEGDYILADSGTRTLTQNDIKGLSKYDLALARNEIYARHGRKFQTKEYSDYFSSKSWYKINPNYNYSDDNSNLNEIEAKNVQLLLDAERQ